MVIRGDMYEILEISRLTSPVLNWRYVLSNPKEKKPEHLVLWMHEGCEGLAEAAEIWALRLQ